MSAGRGRSDGGQPVQEAVAAVCQLRHVNDDDVATRRRRAAGLQRVRTLLQAPPGEQQRNYGIIGSKLHQAGESI